ncbi:hypothetical protein QTG54_004707 [Skeletonema marinoi]|uniref:Uncharacterized protein n=1 Tax=Skeletonema marinoi TaxID=267567 RepID=A0AAD8YCY9_9STRA|nr:hypothetical protein QTG54_004707 [Skeletonema marinoi]
MANYYGSLEPVDCHIHSNGDFESLRYVDDSGDVLVCESMLHPKDSSKKKARVTWRFQRDP